MAEGLLLEESLSVLRMTDVLFHNDLFHVLSLFDVIAPLLEDGVHLGPQAYVLGNRAPHAFVLHLPQNLLVGCAVQRVALRVVRGVVEVCVRSHIPVHVLRLDLEEQAVCVGVQQLAAVSIRPLELVVVEVLHEVLREAQDAHPHVHRAVEH